MKPLEGKAQEVCGTGTSRGEAKAKVRAKALGHDRRPSRHSRVQRRHYESPRRSVGRVQYSLQPHPYSADSPAARQTPEAATASRLR